MVIRAIPLTQLTLNWPPQITPIAVKMAMCRGRLWPGLALEKIGIFPIFYPASFTISSASCAGSAFVPAPPGKFLVKDGGVKDKEMRAIRLTQLTVDLPPQIA